MNHALTTDPMRFYRAKRDAARPGVRTKYSILGFISSGTYGRVYKAKALGKDAAATGFYAIKKFKPDKEGEVLTYTGISQSACREIALNREIDNINVVRLREVMLEDKSIYMVFEYAEHDFLQIIHHHTSILRTSIPLPVIKSLLFQLLNGVEYLHNQHILHRDLKPANILVTSTGTVKIGDLGLARLIKNPLQPLYVGDKVVVTIWYRAPELLLGAKHYTVAVDNWAVGCIFAELLSTRPIFKGEEAKLDAKKNVPFQRDQAIKIFEVLGSPDTKQWPGLQHMPEYASFLRLESYRNQFRPWFYNRLNSQTGYEFICRLFSYDPVKRMTAKEALQHKFWLDEPTPTANAFSSLQGRQTYPLRRVSNDDGTAAPQAKPTAVPPVPVPPASAVPSVSSSTTAPNNQGLLMPQGLITPQTNNASMSDAARAQYHAKVAAHQARVAAQSGSAGAGAGVVGADVRSQTASLAIMQRQMEMQQSQQQRQVQARLQQQQQQQQGAYGDMGAASGSGAGGSRKKPRLK